MGFQKSAIDRGLALLKSTLEQEQRAALSLEAPTGTGKTLMAGHIASRLTAEEPVVWFWFAPFDGLIQQAQRVIREEFAGLKLRDIQTERVAENAAPGDTYVLTWALATNVKSEINTGSERGVPLQNFCRQLKQRGFKIGVIVDESHHSLKAGSQAVAAFSEKIGPDVALLVSATPNDKAMQALLDAGHLGGKVNRISVSRREGVNAGLLKPDLVSTIIKSDESSATADTQQAALQMAVRCHRKLKEQFTELGIGMTPLLLVQADSEEGSIERVRAQLRDEGFTAEQVTVHTAKEPSENLLADARDDRVEVLIFKMAVATGFDAPRASTLCSMRAIKDPDFGMQIVGRITRVDRRLQGRDDLPENLRLGYVFLGTPGKQRGLQAAAQKIEEMQSEYQRHIGTTRVVTVSEAQGQEEGEGPVREPWDKSLLLEPNEGEEQNGGTGISGAGGRTRTYSYPINPALGVPPYLLTVKTNPNRIRDLELTAANNLIIDGDSLIAVTRPNREINVQHERVYAREQIELERAVASMSVAQIEEKAAKNLSSMREGKGVIDLGVLEKELRQKLAREMEQRGLPRLNADDLRLATKQLICLHYGDLKEAVARATQDSRTAARTQEPLPAKIFSEQTLLSARKNIYGVYPPDMNKWERALADELEIADEVIWWHRNAPNTDWGVSLPLDGGRFYWPDFVVCVRGRKTDGGIILLEPKEKVNDIEGLAARKVLTEHPAYGRAMMLYLDRGKWKIVERDDTPGQNKLTQPFYPHLLVTWR